MKQTIFPTLYNKSSKGGILTWTISAHEKDNQGIITIQRGFLEGKIQTQEQIIDKGKNIGKKNETSPYEQAVSESNSKWNLKKTKNGYTEEIDVETNDTKKETIKFSPMLAKDFNKDSNKLNWDEGVVWQPKLDGVRALIGFHANGVVIKSRGNKFYHNLAHIKNLFYKLYTTGIVHDNIIFDCELYTNELTFEEITGICRKQKKLSKESIEKELKIKAFIFDIINIDSISQIFQERYNSLLKMFKEHLPEEIVLVWTEKITDPKCLESIHNKATEQGFEGIMLRNEKGLYKEGPTRSSDLIKMKTMLDDEFEIVNFKEGIGIEKGTVIWTCKTKDELNFNVKPTGTREQRKIWFNNGNKYIGKKLTVQYQELSKDQVPRFPVGIAIRDYE